MRTALKEYGGARGFTASEFQTLASRIAGADLTAWFRRAVASTEELDYSDALEWFGVEFGADGKTLLPKATATAAQREHLAAWVR